MDEEQIAKLQEILTLESQEADKILNSISENPPEQKKEQQESSKKSLREKIKLLFNKIIKHHD